MSSERGCEMTTDNQMLQARILALKKAKAALELVGDVVSVDIRNLLYNSDEGRGLSPSQKCAIEDILGAIEAVLQGLGITHTLGIVDPCKRARDETQQPAGQSHVLGVWEV